MDNILRLLERDCTLTPQQISAMLGLAEDEVRSALSRYEAEEVIVGYKAMVDWDKTDEELVTALIQVKVTPQRGEGFDRVAERIYQYDEVESLFLMSGGYDLTVIIRGRTMKEVALFVAEKLAPLENVTGTSTHFMLKKYKENGVLFTSRREGQERILMV